MKRTAIAAALIASAALSSVLAAATASPASAESCFRVIGSERGAYVSAACNQGGPPYRWVWGSNTFNWEFLGTPNRYCVKVKSGLPSWYEDAVCSKEKEGTSEYTKVQARPGFWWGIKPLGGDNKGVQVFHTTAGAIECGELTLSAEPTSKEPEQQTFNATYGKCEAFGASVTVSEAEYEMTAEGDVSVVSKNIIVTDGVASCTVTIPAGGSNTDLARTEYTNTTEGTIIGDVRLSGVHYEPSGGSCGTKALETNGSYEGEVEISQAETSIEVKLYPIC
jgi:hypothetical protein